MDKDATPALIEADAKAMAEAVNGGVWETDYTEAQQAGWKLKVAWAMRRYGLGEKL